MSSSPVSVLCGYKQAMWLELIIFFYFAKLGSGAFFFQVNVKFLQLVLKQVCSAAAFTLL